MQIRKMIMGVFVVTFLTGVLGCAGAQWKSTTTFGNKTTVKGDEKTMQQLAQKKEYEAQRLQKIQSARPRNATDPIVVALYRPTIADNLAPSFDTKKFFDILVKEFSEDAVIRLVDQKIVDRSQENLDKQPGIGRKRPRVSADVSVFPHVMVEQVAGIDRNTGKIGTMAAFVLKAEIVSHYLPTDEFDVKESGNIFRNQEVTRKFSEKAVETIKTKPHIPGEAYRQEARNADEEQLRSAIDAMLKKLSN